MRRVLMIAYHFPPMVGSSGIQRTLRFVQHLPAFGWEPIVLTASPRAYESVGEDLLRDVPAGVRVKRSFALDTARHLSIAQRYPGFLARPDRWMTWKWSAVPAGLRLIDALRPAAIWSTFPIATAHTIGAALQRRTGLPWIADFRDPMAQDGYPADPRTWRRFKSIEERAMCTAARCVFVTPGAARLYCARYPATDPFRVVVIENGYDEESFAAAEALKPSRGPLNPGCITLLHSGIVYPAERDPAALFEALGQLKRKLAPGLDQLRIRFRAPVHEDLLRRLALSHGVSDLLEIKPPIPYREALEEMLLSDGLIAMQAANSSDQIPAKAYEYLRARRPIIALTDPEGDTAAMLRAAGVRSIARLDSAVDIERALAGFLSGIAEGSVEEPDAGFVARCSRRSRSRQLAALLDEIAGSSGQAIV